MDHMICLLFIIIKNNLKKTITEVNNKEKCCKLIYEICFVTLAELKNYEEEKEKEENPIECK